MENLARKGEREKNNKKRRNNYPDKVIHNLGGLSADIWVLIPASEPQQCSFYSYSQLSTELWLLIPALVDEVAIREYKGGSLKPAEVKHE